jgi:glyoxylase-like metal-dependent hydrolase (beta-lactamase superfamily II)
MTPTLHGAPADFDGGLVEVAGGVWAWLQPNGSWGETNAGLVTGDAAALVFDTCWDSRLARRMLAAMQDILLSHGGPALAEAVNSHADGDHWWGNGALPADMRIRTAERVRDQMRRESSAALMHRVALVARWGRRLPGRVGELAGYIHRMLGPFDFSSVRTRLPDTVFSGADTIPLGGRDVRLIELGPAHTESDVIAHVPDVGVVFAGDLLFIGGTPIVWHGPLENWLDAIETMLNLNAETYVPGHGPPAGRAEVQELGEYFEWLGHALADVAPDDDPGSVCEALVRTPEFARWRRWRDPERLAINVSTVLAARRGEAPSGGRVALFVELTRLSRRLAEPG